MSPPASTGMVQVAADEGRVVSTEACGKVGGMDCPVVLGGGRIFAVTVALAAGLATLVARMVTLAGLGMAAGAVYTPDADTVPTAAFPLGMPLTLQVTAVFAEPFTIALSCRTAAGATVTLAGARLTVTGEADGIVMVAMP